MSNSRFFLGGYVVMGIVLVVLLLTYNNQRNQSIYAELKNIEFEEKINEYEILIERQKNQISDLRLVLQEEESNQDNNSRTKTYTSFKRDEISDYDGFYELDGPTYLYALPYDTSEVYPIAYNSSIRVLHIVKNTFNERWAYVYSDFNDGNGKTPYGYIPVYNIGTHIDPEPLQDVGLLLFDDIYVGQDINTVIRDYKKSYIRYNLERNNAIHIFTNELDYYRSQNEDSNIIMLYPQDEGLLLYTNKDGMIAEVKIYDSSFLIEGGFHVGSSANDAIDFFSSKYEKFASTNYQYPENVHLFSISKNYVLIIRIKNDSSGKVIESIAIGNKNGK